MQSDQSNDGEAVGEVRSAVAEFEGVLQRARAEKYPAEVLEMLSRSAPATWRLEELLDSYLRAGDRYPSDRLKGVMDRAMDLKLQLFFIMEVDLGLYNWAYQDLINANPSLADSALLKLRRMSFDQSLIGKSRILWERLMSLVYYMETGRDIPKTGKGSVKSSFFSWIRTTPRWRYLEPYEQFLESFDASYRTPEYHKRSILRAELLGRRTHDPNALLEPVNRAINHIWEAILAVLSGQAPRVFSDLHRPAGDEHGIDSRYLEQQT